MVNVPRPFLQASTWHPPFCRFFRLRSHLLIAGDLQLCLRSSRRPQVPAAGIAAAPGVVGKAAPNGARAYVGKEWKIGIRMCNIQRHQTYSWSMNEREVTYLHQTYSKKKRVMKRMKTAYMTYIYIWMFPKIVGFPKSSILIRVFHYFHHPFWGKHPYVWFNTHKDTTLLV